MGHPGSSLQKLASSGWRTAKEVGRPFFCPGELPKETSFHMGRHGRLLSKLMICERL